MLLIISENDLLSSVMSDMLRYMGVLSYAVAPREAKEEISNLYSAALVLEDVGDGEAIEAVDAIRKKTDIPIFALLRPFSKIKDAFDCTLVGTPYASLILAKMRDYTRKRGLREIGNYGFGEIRTGTEDGAFYGSVKLPLTKAEVNILNFLLRCFPLPKSSEEILKYVYPTSRKPEKSSLRTHISAINKKFHALFGKRIIALVENEGYRLGISDGY